VGGGRKHQKGIEWVETEDRIMTSWGFAE